MTSGEVVGFASSSRDYFRFRQAIRDLMNAKNKKVSPSESKKHSSHVNQWRFRSCRNETVNLEFFNERSQTGDNIQRQLLHVLSLCNLIEITFLGSI